MAKIKIDLNRKYVRDNILYSPEMMSILGELGNGIAARAGDGYECTVKRGRTRAVAVISAATKEARKDNRDNDTLLRSLG